MTDAYKDKWADKKYKDEWPDKWADKQTVERTDKPTDEETDEQAMLIFLSACNEIVLKIYDWNLVECAKRLLLE